MAGWGNVATIWALMGGWCGGACVVRYKKAYAGAWYGAVAEGSGGV